MDFAVFLGKNERAILTHCKEIWREERSGIEDFGATVAKKEEEG